MFQAALPECRVDNFTSDWNSGVALSALLDYCKPGLFPHWKVLDPSDRWVLDKILLESDLLSPEIESTA